MQTVVTASLTQWRYCSLTLNHRYHIQCQVVLNTLTHVSQCLTIRWPGACFKITMPSYWYGIPVIKISWSHDRVIFIMGIPLTGKAVMSLYWKRALYTIPCPEWIKSLWPSDGIWQHRTWPTLAQVMVCCLTAPSHYLNQCWLIIGKVQSHSSGNHFTKDISAINHWSLFKITCLECHSNFPGANELKHATFTWRHVACIRVTVTARRD